MHDPDSRKRLVPSAGAILLAGAIVLSLPGSISARPKTAAPPSATTIVNVEVKDGGVRMTILVTLTRAASYRITRPGPNRIAVDLERADFDLQRPIDLRKQAGWISDWAFGFLIFGYTRLSLRFDRNVSVVRHEMTKQNADKPARLSIDVVESY